VKGGNDRAITVIFRLRALDMPIRAVILPVFGTPIDGLRSG